MKLFAKFGVAAALVFVTGQAFAQSFQVGRAIYMRECGGYISLNEANNGALSIQLDGLNTYRCNDLRFFDASSRRLLQSYTIRGTNYTLSKEHRASLSQDCRLNVVVSGSHARDTFVVTLPGCSVHRPQPPRREGGYSYQWSRNGNCKLLQGDRYLKLVEDMYCAHAPNASDIVSYEWSNAQNCKVMINRRYANKNVADRFCTARHF